MRFEDVRLPRYNAWQMEIQSLTVVTTDVEETRRVGACLAPLLEPGDVVAISGDLGTGKTAFVQGLARGLGVSTPVTSPTFTLINQYRYPTGLLQHVDCYRLGDAVLEMWDAGLQDMVGDGDIVVIEWAERLELLLPLERIAVRFLYLDERRRQLEFVGFGARLVLVIRNLAQACVSRHEAGRQESEVAATC